MLEDYKYKQDIFYNIVTNAIVKDKLSHAYLIEKNNNAESNKIVLSFIKSIICPSHYFNNSKCNLCNICNRIENGNYPEIRFIKADGLWIKKTQMMQLQEEFTMKPLEGSKRIYVIDDCDKMNAETANSILKFLEEPTDNIIAILMTNNINQVLKTIVSRCQIISLNKENNDNTNDNLYCNLFQLSQEEVKDNLEVLENKLNSIIEFINFFESNGLDTIIWTKKLWHNNFLNRQDNIIAINVIINFYYEVLKYKNGMELLMFKNNEDLIKKISLQDENKLINKIEKLISIKETIKYNLNTNLVIDSMIIELGGV